jgi:CBS domain containing-hemolysin-like protein
MNISERLLALTKLFGKKSNDSTEAEEYEQDLIESVEEFSETITREVMVPRIDIATVAADLDLDKALAILFSCGYS